MVNRGDSAYPFGRGWQLAGLDELVVDSSGALWVRSDGTSLWFADDGAGGFLAADGDLSFATLVENTGPTYTLTAKSGEKINFDSSGKITSRVDRNDNTVSYTYTSGELTKITDPFSRETTFSYTSGRLTSVTDFASRSATLAYDGSGRLTSITQPDPDGAGSLSAPVTSFSYDATTHRLTQRSDALNQDTDYTYGSIHGRLTTITHPDSSDIELESLQTIGLPTATTGNSLTAADPLGTITDERGYDSEFRVDRFGNTIEWKNQLGHKTLTYRNATGQSVKVVGADPDGASSLTSPVTILGYNPSGDLVYQQNPDSTEVTWTYTTTFHQVASVTDELDRTRSFAYDTDGNLTTETDAAGFTTTHAYNSLGLRTSTTTPDPDNTGPLSASLTSFSYDSYGRLTTITNPDSSTRTLAYDSADNLTSETNELSYAATSTYDTLGRLTSSTDRESATTSFEYDAIGQLTKQTDALGNATDYEYNNRGFQTKVTQPDPDGTGSLTASVTSFSYDVFDRVTQKTDPEGGVTVTTYDDAGNVLSIKDPVNNTTSFAYDGMGRVAIETNQLSDTRSFQYEAAGTYDNLGRLLTVDNDGTSGGPNVVLTSAYDAAGNRTSLSATIDSTDDFENSYTYDLVGRLTRLDQIGVTGGNTVSEKLVDFAYNAVGQFATIARYNDTAGGSGDEIATSTYSYDSAGKLTGLAYKQGGTNLFTPYSWTFDNASRITEFVGADGTSDYTYDKTSQLTAADHDYQTDESYSYDANGNRDSGGYTTGSDNRMTADGTYTYTYDDEGNRTSRTDDTTDYETLYEWDYRNRLTKVTELDDSDNTLKVVKFTYDVFDRRIGKAVDTTSPFDLADAAIERYVYDDLNGVSSVDGGNVVLDFVDPDGSGTTAIALSARQLYANRVDQILAKEDVTVATSSADRVQWPLVDNLGTVRDLVENDGALGEHYTYDAYGQVISGDTSVIRYLYTSREHDADAGLQYNRARWYDAAVGRWISQDPIGFAAGDANFFRYVGNEVTVNVDPSGHWSYEMHLKFLQDYFKDYESARMKKLALIGGVLDVYDTYADKDHQYRHFMISGTETPAEAFRKAEMYVNQQLILARDNERKAKYAEEEGKKRDAKNWRDESDLALARALHTVMDSTSPAHTTPEGWPEKYEGANIPKHSPSEKQGIENKSTIEPAAELETKKRMEAAYQAFKNNTDYKFPVPSGP